MPTEPVPPPIPRSVHRGLHCDPAVTPCREQHAELGHARDWLTPQTYEAVTSAIAGCRRCPLLDACDQYARLIRPQGVVMAAQWWRAAGRGPVTDFVATGWRKSRP